MDPTAGSGGGVIGIATRPAVADDLAFVFSTWLKGYRYGSSFGRGGMRNSVFYPAHREILEAILGREATDVLIASVADTPGIDVGYLVYEPNVLHWLYVKESFRRRGIARMLLLAAGFQPPLKGVEISHVSDDWYRFLKQRAPGAKYNPYRQFWPNDRCASPPGNPSGGLDRG
jgi:GNAT superfamily N-acetyltransferase